MSKLGTEIPVKKKDFSEIVSTRTIFFIGHITLKIHKLLLPYLYIIGFCCCLNSITSCNEVCLTRVYQINWFVVENGSTGLRRFVEIAKMKTKRATFSTLERASTDGKETSTASSQNGGFSPFLEEDAMVIRERNREIVCVCA